MAVRTNEIKVAIIIAKDHESSGFKAALKEHDIEVRESTQNGIKIEEFLLTTIDETKQVTCYATYFNSQGSKIDEHTTKFVDLVRPRFFTTIGVCGSTQPPGTVMFFSNAILLNGDTVAATTTQYGHKETARKFAEEKESTITVADPHKIGTCIFTSDKIEENVQKVLEEHPGCSAVDMEIGVVFKTILNINKKRTESNKTYTLHAIKAVSDKGGKEERDLNKHQAIKGATEVFIEYLRFLLAHNHLALSDAPPTSLEANNSAPVPKGNSGGTYTNYGAGGGGYVSAITNNWVPK